VHFQWPFVVPDILTVGVLFRSNSMGNVSYFGPAAFTEEFVPGVKQVRCDYTPSYCAHHDQDRGACYQWPWTYRCVLPNMQTTVFCLLKTDLIHIFYAGVLPLFTECKQLTDFSCHENQFTGAYSRVSMDRSVEV
jgi:hypothetical protein